MRKRLLCTLILIIPYIAIAQNASTPINIAEEKGIKWLSGLSWDQVRQKAIQENKYIFVDCFATWCGPCKLMDKQVYPNDTVGNLLKPGFLSVRMQMDSTKNDNEETKEWYTIVKIFEKEYSVNAMPTFLFFSPNGKIVHKEVGGKNVKQFVSLIKMVTDPTKQYYTLVEQYKSGKLSYAQMPALAKMANSVGETEISQEIARAYLTGFLEKNEQSFFIKENQQFIYNFYGILRSSDRLLNFYLQEPTKMDTLLGKPGASQQIVDYVITKDVITPAINQAKDENKEPVWKEISNDIRKKFEDVYAEKTVLNARVNYYKSQKDWSQYSKYLVKKVQMEKQKGLPKYNSANFLNENAWEIFLYSNSNTDLKKALAWSNRSLELIDSSSFNVGPNMDTNANILYKMGKTKAAINQEERALKRIIADSEKYDFVKSTIQGYIKTLQNMKNKRPTYLEQGAIWKRN